MVQELYQNYSNAFSEKNIIGGNWGILGPKMTCPQNSYSFTQMIFF